MDTALYNECFTGRAKVRAHSRVCFSDSHLKRSCPLVINGLQLGVVGNDYTCAYNNGSSNNNQFGQGGTS